jgi:hypothetical protein
MTMTRTGDARQEAAQRRYDALCKKAETAKGLSRKEAEESTGLFYLLNPQEQYWLDVEPTWRPEDIWPQCKKWSHESRDIRQKEQ